MGEDSKGEGRGPAAADLGLAEAVSGLPGAGAPRWLPEGQGLGWDRRCSGPGWEIETPRGRAFLQGALAEDQLRLDLIVVERKGRGVGTAVMEALKAHADARGLEILLRQVENWRFFARLEWLDPERGPDDVVLNAWYQPPRPSRSPT